MDALPECGETEFSREVFIQSHSLLEFSLKDLMQKYLNPAESLILFILQTTSDEAFQLITDLAVRWKWTSIFDKQLDLLQIFQYAFFLSAPGDLSCDHLVTDYAKRPDVAFDCVLIVTENLWRHVEGSPHFADHLLRYSYKP